MQDSNEHLREALTQETLTKFQQRLEGEPENQITALKEKKLVHADHTLVDAYGQPLKAEDQGIEPEFPLPKTWSKLLAQRKELIDLLNAKLPEQTSIRFDSSKSHIPPTFWGPDKVEIMMDQETMDYTKEFINLTSVYQFAERIGALPYLSGAQITGFDKTGFPVFKLAPDQAARIKKRNANKAALAAKKQTNLRANAPKAKSKPIKRNKNKIAKASRKRNRG